VHPRGNGKNQSIQPLQPERKKIMTAVLLNAAIEFIMKNIVPGTTYRYRNFYDAAILLKNPFSTGVMSEALKTLVASGELKTPKNGVYSLAGNIEYPFLKKDQICLDVLNDVMNFNVEYSFGELWYSVHAKNPKFSAGVLTKILRRMIDTKQIERIRHGFYIRKTSNKLQ
jgi:hypothetical protein